MSDIGRRSHAIWAAWRAICDPGTADRLCQSMPVPGRLGLRQRFELVACGAPDGYGPEAFDLPVDLWDEQIGLFERGDAALRDNDHDGAVRAFTALEASHRDGDYPAALVEARLGLGDAARQIDDVDAAIAHYAGGVALAARCGYEYCRVRGAIPLAYLHMRVGSSQQASLEFERARRVARHHGWRLDEANALTGLGEAFQRLRRPDMAAARLKEALRLFEDLRSSEGVANAAVQLGEIHRRERDIGEAIHWYGRAVAAASQAGGVIALVNALDGLAEVELAAGDLDAAREHHQQAYDVAGGSYPRGQGHALNGLARCALAAYERADPDSPGRDDDLRLATSLFGWSLVRYLAIDDPVSAATSQTGLARCAELAGDLATAMQRRVDAVASIESMRAEQIAHSGQDEYVRRFDRYYLEALTTAIRIGDLEAFTTVFEAVAGRRLAAIVQAADALDAGDAAALGTAAADLRARGWPVNVAGPRPRRERIKRLGRLALREAVTDAAGEAFDDVMAAVYQPFDAARAAGLLASLGLESSTMLLVAVLPGLPQLVWLWLDRDRPVQGGVHDLEPQTLELVRRLGQQGLRADEVPGDVAALRDLLPGELTELLPDDRVVTIVPAGLAWGLPWPAVPLADGGFLGERVGLAVCPSLAMLAHLRAGPAWTPPQTVGAWRSPAVGAHTLEAFAGCPSDRVAVLRSADEARLASINGCFDMVVLVAHGKPVHRLVHYLELDEHTFITPGEVLDGRTPRQLALVACWGANAPEAGFGDPLTIATLALARGSSGVLATTSELLDDVASNRFTSMVLADALDMPLPQAVHRATVRWLRAPGHRDGPLSRWAPLVAMGV